MLKFVYENYYFTCFVTIFFFQNASESNEVEAETKNNIKNQWFPFTVERLVFKIIS